MAKETPSMEGSLRLGLVCADPVRVIGLAAIFSEEEKVEVIPLSGPGALHEASFTLILIDSTSTVHLFELLETFRRTYPKLRLIVMGFEEEPDYIQRVIGAGAKGYLCHAAKEEEIRMAVDIVADGSVWAPRKVLARLLENAAERPRGPIKSREAKITGREAEVLKLLIAGHPNREIARSLGIDQVTVKGHVGRLMRKMGVTNRISLSVQAATEHLAESKLDMI